MNKAKIAMAAEKSKLNKQVRDLQRLISYEKTPEEIKKAKIGEIRDLRKKQKYIKEVELFEARYKKVRFVERIKSERHIKKIRKQLAACKEEEKAALQSQLQTYEDNLLYITHFPRSEKYLSIYAKDCDLYKEQRAAILAKIKERVKQKEEQLKADIKEENALNAPAKQQEEDLDDEFFLSDKPKAQKRAAPASSSVSEAKPKVKDENEPEAVPIVRSKPKPVPAPVQKPKMEKKTFEQRKPKPKPKEKPVAPKTAPKAAPAAVAKGKHKNLEGQRAEQDEAKLIESASVPKKLKKTEPDEEGDEPMSIPIKSFAGINKPKNEEPEDDDAPEAMPIHCIFPLIKRLL